MPRLNTPPLTQLINAFTTTELLETSFPGPLWLVDKLIPIGGITCIAGKAGVGKSFLSLQLAYSLTQGTPFLDQFPTTQSNVCWITHEEVKRLLQIRIKNLGIPTATPIVFSDDETVLWDSLTNAWRIIDLTIKHNCKVVIFDSFIRFFGGDENISKDVKWVRTFLRRLIDQGLTVIFIHHVGKEDTGRAGIDKLRGSSDIGGLLDSALVLSKVHNELMVSHAKSRWDQEIESFYVHVPSFTGNDNAFRFLGFCQQGEVEVISPINLAMDDCLSVIQKAPVSIHEAEILRQVQKINPDHKKGTVGNALSKLMAVKKVVATRQGNKVFYSLPSSEQPTNGQRLKEDSRLSEASDVEIELAQAKEVV